MNREELQGRIIEWWRYAPRWQHVAAIAVVLLFLSAIAATVFMLGPFGDSGQKNEQQLQEEISYLVGNGCPSGTAFISTNTQTGQQGLECWREPPSEWRNAGYIERGEDGVPLGEPPLATTQVGETTAQDPASAASTASAAVEAGQSTPPTPKPTPEWQGQPAGETAETIAQLAITTGLTPGEINYFIVMMAIIFLLAQFCGFMDARERNQVADAIGAIALALFNFWGANLIVKIAPLMVADAGILDQNAEILVVRISAILVTFVSWVIVVILASASGRDYSAIATYAASVGLQAIIRGNLGLFGLALNIPDAPLLTASEVLLSWASGLGLGVKFTIWSWAFLATAILFYLLEVFKVRSIIKLLLRQQQELEPDWWNLAVAIATIVLYVALRFTYLNPIIVLVLAIAFGIVMANAGRRYGLAARRPDNNPGEVAIGWSPYLPWDGQAFAMVFLALCMAILGVY